MELKLASQDMDQQRKEGIKARQAVQSTHASNLSLARRYEKENTKKLTRQTPVLEVLSALEADGESQQKEIVVLEKEIKTLKRTIHQKDKVIDEATAQVEELQRQPHDLPALHNDIKMLLHTIEGLQEENKTLTRIQHAKTQAIEELSLQLESRAGDDDQIADAHNKIKSHELREKELLAELNTVKLAEQKRTKAILKEEAVDVALSAKEWIEERKYLKNAVKKLTEENENHVRLQKAHNTRVMTLQDRVNHITELLKEAQARRMPSSLLLHPPNVTDPDSVTAHDALVAEEEGRDLVPVEMYHFLEVEVQAMRSELREKSSLLLERDEVIESLEKKMDVLSRTRAADNKRKERETASLKGDLEEARIRSGQLEEQLRKKETELRGAVLKAKAAQRKSHA